MNNYGDLVPDDSDLRVLGDKLEGSALFDFPNAVGDPKRDPTDLT